MYIYLHVQTMCSNTIHDMVTSAGSWQREWNVHIFLVSNILCQLLWEMIAVLENIQCTRADTCMQSLQIVVKRNSCFSLFLYWFVADHQIHPWCRIQWSYTPTLCTHMHRFSKTKYRWTVCALIIGMQILWSMLNSTQHASYIIM